MNIIKLFLVIILNIYMKLSTTSPNVHTELGTQVGDRPAIDGSLGELQSEYMTTIIMSTLTSLYGYYHLNSKLTVLDGIYFILTTTGIYLRWSCYRALGKFFTFNLGVRTDHELITTGPYQYLIHPSYTGQIVLNFGTLLFMKTNISLIIALLVYMFVRGNRRIMIEEAFLATHFGDKYKQYISRRYRLIPFIY